MAWIALLILLHSALTAHCAFDTSCNGTLKYNQGVCNNNKVPISKCCNQVYTTCQELSPSGAPTGFAFTAYKDSGECCCCNTAQTSGYMTVNDNQLCAFNNAGPSGTTIYQKWWAVGGGGYCQQKSDGTTYSQVANCDSGCQAVKTAPSSCDQSLKWCYDVNEVWGSRSPSPSPSPSPSRASSPRITGDPHYLGFDGTSYDFTGFAGGFFNMYSDPAHQVNMLFDNFGFKGLTFIKELGIKFGANILIAVKSLPLPDGRGAAIEVVVNNQSIPLEVDTENQASIGDVHLNMVQHEFGHYTINVTTPTIMVQVSKMQKSNLHLDVSLSFVKAPANPEEVHGSLGQSLRWVNAGGEGVFEGDETDYLVSGLFADDFTFNKFQAGKSLQPVVKTYAKDHDL